MGNVVWWVHVWKEDTYGACHLFFEKQVRLDGRV